MMDSLQFLCKCSHLQLYLHIVLCDPLPLPGIVDIIQVLEI